jgi:sodium/bile acid cotransporter 7
MARVILSIRTIYKFLSGASGGFLHSDRLTRWGVMLIFFFQGLTLSLSALRSGVMQWRLHLFVQLFIFGLIPLLA